VAASALVPSQPLAEMRDATSYLLTMLSNGTYASDCAVFI
jgi:hypothetical protein